jgi:hypothetical protein
MIVAFAIAVVLGAAVLILAWPQSDSRLIGTWQSDREKTFAKPEKSPFFDEKKMEGFKKLFGKLKVRYTDNRLTMDQEGVTTTAEYRVVGKDKHSVVISTSLDLSGEQELVQIHFVDSDTYWLLDSSGVMKEYFTRVK